MPVVTRRAFRLSLLTLLVSASTSSFAAGFMLQEQNAVQTGDFGAGGAAIAEDASTAWFNPAGLTRLQKPQLVLAANEILFKTNYSGLVSYSNSTSSASNENQYESNASGGTSNFVPTFHLAYPMSPRVVAGFSVTTPFGLATDYSTDTYIRYSATETKLRTIDISPSLGVKLNDKLSAGFGVDAQRLIARFDSYAALDPQGGAPTDHYDTLSHNVASDWAPAWHAGFLFEPSNATRFGLAYHSKVVHHATGYSLFTGPLADPNLVNGGGLQPSSLSSSFYGNNAKTTVYLPASTMLSAYHDMNNRWAVMGSVVYTQWNIFKQLTLNNVVDSSLDGYDLVKQNIDVNVPQNFHNTWRASVGTNYKLTDKWLVRTGVGFDESPTNNTDRNLRLPDGNRYAIAFGGRYQAKKDLALDAGWTHQFIQTARINNTASQDTQSVYVNGKSYSHADVLGAQLTWNFG